MSRRLKIRIRRLHLPLHTFWLSPCATTTQRSNTIKFRVHTLNHLPVGFPFIIKRMDFRLFGFCYGTKLSRTTTRTVAHHHLTHGNDNGNNGAPLPYEGPSIGLNHNMNTIARTTLRTLLYEPLGSGALVSRPCMHA